MLHPTIVIRIPDQHLSCCNTIPRYFRMKANIRKLLLCMEELLSSNSFCSLNTPSEFWFVLSVVASSTQRLFPSYSLKLWFSQRQWLFLPLFPLSILSHCTSVVHDWYFSSPSVISSSALWCHFSYVSSPCFLSA